MTGTDTPFDPLCPRHPEHTSQDGDGNYWCTASGCKWRVGPAASQTAQIVQIAPARDDIPGSLRRLSDAIENGTEIGLPPRFVVVLLVCGDDSFVTYGFGRLSNLEVIGALHRAASCGLVDEAQP